MYSQNPYFSERRTLLVIIPFIITIPYWWRFDQYRLLALGVRIENEKSILNFVKEINEKMPNCIRIL